MITLSGVTKGFKRGAGAPIIDNVSLHLPQGRSVALLGRNGAGKSTLLGLIAGSVLPDAGTIERQGRVSWPIGFAGSFHPDLTGAQNLRFVARIYGCDSQATLQFASAFAELGPYFHRPVRTYSAGMKARLAFAASMAVPFDWHLVDEVTAVGDASFKRKCDWYLMDRLRTGSAIVVSHAMPLLERMCDCAILLDRGKLAFFDEVREGISAHHAALRK